jgi:CSLREA domain-containing protein
MLKNTFYPRVFLTVALLVFALSSLISVLFLAVSADAATLTVNSIADDGTGTCTASNCTLRDAISSAVPDDTITFSLPANSTITLVIGELLINKNLTINGPGANMLTVQRSHAAGTQPFRVFNILSNVAIIGLTIANGSSPIGAGGFNTSGGGILNNGAAATALIINSIISGNLAVAGNSGGGGGIANVGGTVLIENSTISGNSAYGGGGIRSSGGTVAILNSTISGNTANIAGGGIGTTLATMTIVNSTISGNVGLTGGGGINTNTATVNIFNSTISGNSVTAFGRGGGIENFAETSTVNVRNTIIANNTNPAGAPDFMGTLTSQGYNLIGNTGSTIITGDTTGNQLNVDPNLGPLQDNGGSTKTHALLTGSTAIDTGNSNGSTTDQRGFVRPVDDPTITNASGGDGSDIGAYEVQADQLPGCNTINRIVNNDNDSGAGSLRAVIANVCAGTSITFAANVSGAINLTSGELLIGKSLTISGPGANVLTVQRSAAPGTPAFRIFDIASANVNATISGLTIANGNAFAGPGGGILSFGTLTLTNSTISGNAALNGGGLWNDFGTMTLTNSTISGNTVSSDIFAGSGGGIFNHGGTVNITNSTLSGNSAIGPGGTSDSGGGILTNVGMINITNSTVSGNSADFGGGIRNVNGGVVRSKNSIIALNTSASGPDVNGPLASQGFNLIGIASGATIAPAQLSDQIGVTPAQLNLGPLQDNGGPTSTHALLSGSFAIDKGHSSGSTTDQRGFVRPVDDPTITNASDGDGSDIGAFEYGAIVPRIYLPIILG